MMHPHMSPVICSAILLYCKRNQIHNIIMQCQNHDHSPKIDNQTRTILPPSYPLIHIIPHFKFYSNHTKLFYTIVQTMNCLEMWTSDFSGTGCRCAQTSTSVNHGIPSVNSKWVYNELHVDKYKFFYSSTKSEGCNAEEFS